LILKRYGACERLSALFAQPFHILRVEKTSAIVLFPHIFQGQAGVTQDRLIGIQHGSIGAQHVDKSGDDIGNQAQIALVGSQSLFIFLATPQQRIGDVSKHPPYMKEKAPRRDLPFRWIVLINAAAREFNWSTGRRMAGEWTLMLGFKNKFNVDHTRSENHAFYDVPVSRERSGKWHSELVADGVLPFHEQTRNLKHYIFRVVRHNAIQVRSSPRLVVLMDERFDVKTRC